MPTSLGVAASEALYTALLPVFTGPGRPPRELLHAALRVAAPVAVGASIVYAAVVVAAEPDRQSVWLSFAPVLGAIGLNGVYAAFLTADRRYPLAILRVPLATGIAVALAAATLPFWRTITAIAVAISLGQLLTLALLALLARTAPRTGHAPRALVTGSLFGGAGAVFVATLAGGQLVVVAERFLASSLTAGAVALLAFARGVALLPVMFAQALGGGIFPAATERFGALERESLSRVALTGIRLSLLTALASTAWLILCRRDLVQIAFERHEFDAADARQTATLVAILASSLAGVAAAAAAAKTLFALGRRDLVLLITLGGVALYLAAALVLREPWDLEGLAWAFVVASTVVGVASVVAVVWVLALRPSLVAREWLFAPAVHAGAFACGAVVVWFIVGEGHGSFARAAAAVVAVLVGGLAALTAAIRLANGLEYSLLRRVVRRA